MTDDIPIFPVAQWSTGPVPAYHAVVVCFDFLSHTTQRPEEATPGRHYVLTKQQALDLVADLQKAVEKLQTSEVSSPPGQKH